MSETLGGLQGSVTALATPFAAHAIDAAAFAVLCSRQIAGGTRGLVVGGTSGEGSALRPDEFSQLVAIAAEFSPKPVPVIAGCGAASTEAAVTLATLAARHGADALLVSVPPYVRPTQEGIVAHIRAVAHATDRPIIAYDVPGRAAVGIADATVARLFEAGLIVAIKDATADLARPTRLRALCGEGLRQFSGDDATAAAHRAMGGHGCISVTANVTPALCARLHTAWDARAVPLFAGTRDLLAPLTEALFTESNPIPLKAALASLGLCAARVRSPLTHALPATRERIERVLAAVMPREANCANLPALLGVS